ncbi:HEAT repeat domain-containing protein [Halosimplex marinum]|uniref:HEAT repeat domain-containing protein n=1 Tax=Halosimplex marinum TaxID=3396620 RepID=UPI003F54FA4B
MTDASDAAGEFERLADRAVSDPDAVSVDALVDALRRDPPEGAEPVRRAFASVTEADPSTVPDAVAALGSFAADHEGATAARVAYASLVAAHPERVEGVAPELLEAVEGDDPDARDHAFHALESLAGTRPAELLPEAVPVLRAKLGAESATERSAALAVTAELARQRPAAVAAAAPELLALATTEREFDTGEEYFDELPDQLKSQLEEEKRRAIRTRMVAALALVEVARADIEAGVAVVDPLVERLPDETNLTVREATYDLVWLIGQQRPAAVRSTVEPLAARLSAEDDTAIRGKVARALGILADEHDEAVAAAVASDASTLRDLLRAGEPVALGGAVGLLSYLAERRPEVVEPVAPRLRELAADGPTYVRGNAIWALSYVGSDAAAETLDDIAATDDDEDVRAIAAEASRRLDDA